MDKVGNEEPEFGFLGQLFGPKGENEDLVVKLITMVLLDYSYWRKNYFPDDPLVLTSELKRRTEDHRDRLLEMTSSLVARLRRSFPIYSPRYIGHQLSETTIASVVGAFAGTLYNCNNVTPEAGIETVEMEIEACNDVLRMLGFDSPPPPQTAYKDFEKYKGELTRDYGWCHLTSGGTVANLEALWVARAVKFFPLAMRDVCVDSAIDLQVARPGSLSWLNYEGGLPRRKWDTVSICELVDDRKAIEFRPMEVLRMLGKAQKLIEAQTSLKDRGDRTPEQYLWYLLGKAERTRREKPDTTQFRPKIFSTGAAHYSIVKAADILGIGRDAIVDVPMDRAFRMDVGALLEKMEEVRKNEPKSCVLAVIGAAGTTEEGAVDPVHEIVQLRRDWEVKYQASFWIHVDGAWGGFIRSMFVDPPGDADPRTAPLSETQLVATLGHIGKDVLSKEPFKLDTRSPGIAKLWLKWVVDELNNVIVFRNGDSRLALPTNEQLTKCLDAAQERKDYSVILTVVEDILHCAAVNLGHEHWQGEKTYLDERRRQLVVESVQKSTTDTLFPAHKWPDNSVVGLSMLAIEDADSVTVDPHKMGYCVYPNGAVAYRSDLVRHFILHQAPYVTDPDRPDSSVDEGGVEPAPSGGHFPIRYVKEVKEPGGVGKPAAEPSTEAFARYILEGSRPGAAACSLWLSSKTLAFDKKGIGEMIGSSLQAARLLHQYLEDWDTWRNPGEKGPFRYALYSPEAPDTNIVIFAVAPDGCRNLREFNEINNEIYRRFSILAEHGNRSFSYMQRYFLSKTDFKATSYPLDRLFPFFQRAGIAPSQEEYAKAGVVVLRATVMNPYLRPMLQPGPQGTKKDLLFEFVTELEREATLVIARRHARSPNSGQEDSPAQSRDAAAAPRDLSD